jgi:tetratricopeptide (TPR) repeat protein
VLEERIGPANALAPEVPQSRSAGSSSVASVEPQDGGDMMRDHPSLELLDAFMRGLLPAEENTGVLFHLLSGCSSCQAVTQGYWELLDTEPEIALPERYDEVVNRAFDTARRAGSALGRERLEAHALLHELAAHPEAQREGLIAGSDRFASWGLCELLLARSQKEWLTAPRRAIATAALAAAVSDRLSGDRYPGLLIFDLRARCQASLGNTLRITGDLLLSAQAFARAGELLAQGTGDRLEKARWLDLKASLLVGQGRLAQAISLLDRAAAVYRRAGQRHLLGRTLTHKGHALMSTGRFAEAVTALRLGVSWVDADREPRLALLAQHNLAVVLNEVGRPVEALSLLARNRALYERIAEPLDHTRLRFLEGQIALSLGSYPQAEAALGEVRQTFVEHGMIHDAALASLDLAGAYAAQGLVAELRFLASETLVLFQSLNLSCEALAAWLLLEKAAQADRVSYGRMREIAADLRQKLLPTQPRGLPA